MNELKPCPFCGCNHIQRDIQPLFYGVRCANCGASIRSAHDLDECEEAWNTRVDNQRPATDGSEK